MFTQCIYSLFFCVFLTSTKFNEDHLNFHLFCAPFEVHVVSVWLALNFAPCVLRVCYAHAHLTHLSSIRIFSGEQNRVWLRLVNVFDLQP